MLASRIKKLLIKILGTVSITDTTTTENETINPVSINTTNLRPTNSTSNINICSSSISKLALFFVQLGFAGVFLNSKCLYPEKYHSKNGFQNISKIMTSKYFK